MLMRSLARSRALCRSPSLSARESQIIRHPSESTRKQIDRKREREIQTRREREKEREGERVRKRERETEREIERARGAPC